MKSSSTASGNIVNYSYEKEHELVTKIEIINYAYYEGNWEKHTKENDYRQDCFYISEIDFRKNGWYINFLLA